MATVAPHAPLDHKRNDNLQSLSRYRSLRKPKSQQDIVSPPMPPSAMAQAAASASLQRSQSRYHRPASTARAQPGQAPPLPSQISASRSANQLRPPPANPQPRPQLAQHRTTTSPQTQKPHTQRPEPNARHHTSSGHIAAAPNGTHANFTSSPGSSQPHRSNSPRQQSAAHANSPQDTARADTRRLFELEAYRQRQLQERLRAQRDAARQAGPSLQQQRSREAMARISDSDRARNVEVRREARRMKAEADRRLQEAEAAQKLEEERQDERIRALARQKYEEQEKERKEEERRQELLDEQNRAAIEVKREEHRRKIEERERKQELKERKLVEKNSQKNLRAAMGPKAAVGGIGLSDSKLTGGSDTSVPKAEGRLRNVPTLRRRESDRPSMLKHKSSMEVIAGVFRRNSESVKPLETIGTKFEDVPERQQPIFIKQGGGGAVPGIDAPISASNAGERRVLVVSGSSSMYLPITPTTTPVDLIYSASNVMSEDIDPKKSVLLEHFSKIGIQRPLRKYEHVRDVLNSWDDDKQNSLYLVPSATGGDDPDLVAETVVNLESPSDQSFLMYYSQKPGKWDKRFITLRTDGQVVHSRKESAKDFSTICHMSDFDIYTPMPQALSKKINPPKKICFGVKSQQKSAMFLSTENFVHFFATSDKVTAAAWYSAVQGWRSWYLVNVMGEGQTSRLQPSAAAHGLEVDAQTAFAQGDKRSSHYQLGSFRPLLDLDLFGKPDENPNGSHSETNQGNDKVPHRSNITSNRAAGPPNSFRNPGNTEASQLHQRARNSSSSSHTRPEKDSTFAATGLLGQAYAQRQRELDGNADSRADSAGPFTEGPSLLSEIDSALGGIGRSTTRKERGPRGLVESATTPVGALDGRHRTRGASVSQTSAGRPRTSRDDGEAFKPFLDVSSGSLFAGGSLLRQAELEGKIKRDGVPVIERTRGFEVSVATGEGH